MQEEPIPTSQEELVEALRRRLSTAPMPVLGRVVLRVLTAYGFREVSRRPSPSRDGALFTARSPGKNRARMAVFVLQRTVDRKALRLCRFQALRLAAWRFLVISTEAAPAPRPKRGRAVQIIGGPELARLALGARVGVRQADGRTWQLDPDYFERPERGEPAHELGHLREPFWPRALGA
jgi:hypothetical protein